MVPPTCGAPTASGRAPTSSRGKPPCMPARSVRSSNSPTAGARAPPTWRRWLMRWPAPHPLGGRVCDPLQRRGLHSAGNADPDRWRQGVRLRGEVDAGALRRRLFAVHLCRATGPAVGQGRCPGARSQRHQRAAWRQRPGSDAAQRADAVSNDDGWAHLGRGGSQIGDQASFDSGNYCYRKLSDPIEATGLFEVKPQQPDARVLYAARVSGSSPGGSDGKTIPGWALSRFVSATGWAVGTGRPAGLRSLSANLCLCLATVLGCHQAMAYHGFGARHLAQRTWRPRQPSSYGSNPRRRYPHRRPCSVWSGVHR